MKTPGRNQLIVIVGSVIVIGSGAFAVMQLEPEQAKTFLDFLSDFGKWSIGFAVAGSAAIKVAGVLKNGKQPEA
jgi:hypothetical protein